LDNIYYTIVEQATQNKTSSSNSNNSSSGNVIPRIVLDSLVEAAGKLGTYMHRHFNI